MSEAGALSKQLAGLATDGNEHENNKLNITDMELSMQNKKSN